jgi:hypothetical protein
MNKFKVGDKVRSPILGVGVVEDVKGSESAYPIIVKWVGGSSYAEPYSYFTLEGHYYIDGAEPDNDIELLEGEDTAEENKIKADAIEDKKFMDICKKIDEEDTNRMEEVLEKKVDEAINPKHCKVDGIPETIEIMQGLMTKEQLEGFLLGNIIKYAYRYGRKGDKQETAGKIEWYAQKLKELKECKSE